MVNFVILRKGQNSEFLNQEKEGHFVIAKTTKHAQLFHSTSAKPKSIVEGNTIAPTRMNFFIQVTMAINPKHFRPWHYLPGMVFLLQKPID